MYVPKIDVIDKISKGSLLVLLYNLILFNLQLLRLVTNRSASDLVQNNIISGICNANNSYIAFNSKIDRSILLFNVLHWLYKRIKFNYMFMYEAKYEELRAHCKEKKECSNLPQSSHNMILLNSK